jgi:hypothetical protein
MGGVFKKPSAQVNSQPAQTAATQQQTAVAQAQVEGERREIGEQEAARRKVRRSGQRSLLSSARLNAESGISSLGSGPSL